MRISPDYKRIVIAEVTDEYNPTYYTRIHVYDLESLEYVSSMEKTKDQIYDMEIGHDGKSLVTVGFDIIRVWNISTGEMVDKRKGFLFLTIGEIYEIEMHPEKNEFVIEGGLTGARGKIKIYELKEDGGLGKKRKLERYGREVVYVDGGMSLLFVRTNYDGDEIVKTAYEKE